ncbi:hypothetical protein GCM10011583_11520 [Streptomyces camponoticapitis]|uniref:Helix-turn-helix domain-containing protein n=1 Tax=Streptomyces camponoticapitis TaxID=1616125 RepID=A0ABQ2DZD1_9ACTN|nr:hypothetical protein [Streptomyces camponoticapitis]GGJ81780.1 hypothetical protein GCM10011583_11520 [Streptomyces camponoticapitis]
MGSRLYVEVLDFAPETLTHREKLFLAVLADDARDTTRITWSSVESPKTLRRGKVSRAQVYEVIKALISKGCLERISAGQKNGVAKYRILPLQSPEIPDADTDAQGPDSADTDRSQSQGFPDTDAASQCQEFPDTDPSQRPETPDTDPESQCPENPDTDESQCPEIPDVSVRESRTPTLSPLSTRPLSFGDDPSEPAGQDDAEPEPEIEAEIVTAQVIVGEWLERVPKRPPSSVIGQVAKQVRVLLDEDHIEPYDIRRGIATWMKKGLHPSTLPSVVNEVMNAMPAGAPAARRAPGNNLFDPASGTTVFDRARARAAARTAQEGPTP